jgi:hypothetical protein
VRSTEASAEEDRDLRELPERVHTAKYDFVMKLSSNPKQLAGIQFHRTCPPHKHVYTNKATQVDIHYVFLFNKKKIVFIEIKSIVIVLVPLFFFACFVFDFYYLWMEKKTSE